MGFTLGELLESNPIYAQGEFYDPDIYKTLVPRHTYSAVVITEEMREKGFYKAVFMEVASHVASLALLIFPCLMIYGASHFAFTVGVGVLWGLISSTPIVSTNRLGVLDNLRAKGDIIACLDQTGRTYSWIKKEFFVPTLFKATLFAWMWLPFRVAKLAPFFITAAVSYKVGQFVENTLFGFVEKLAELRREKEFIAVY